MAIGPTIEDIHAARGRLASRLPDSPLIRARDLEAVGHLDAPLLLKIETLQPTHSFKIRGALNAVLTLAGNDDGRRNVITASAGNHGAALAWAGREVGLPVTVITPRTAPGTKLEAISRAGARLIADAATYDDAERLAFDMVRDGAGLYVSPYNDAAIMAGAGTIALEILESDPRVERVLVPLGGGGLLGGIAVALKALAPRVELGGVEAAASPVFTTSLAAGAITTVAVGPTLADGLAGNLEPGSATFSIVRRLVDRVVAVGEPALRTAIRDLAVHERLVAEGAGVAALAAVLDGTVPLRGRRTVVVISGGNIDTRALIGILSC
jgi:threonine dehydratase